MHNLPRNANVALDKCPVPRLVLPEAFAEVATGLGLADLDLTAVTGVMPIAGDERRFTQAISRWAYEHDYHGITYTSRLHHRFTGCAVFESALILPIGDRFRSRRSIATSSASLGRLA